MSLGNNQCIGLDYVSYLQKKHLLCSQNVICTWFAIFIKSDLFYQCLYRSPRALKQSITDLPLMKYLSFVDLCVSDSFFIHQGATCLHFQHPDHQVKVG